MTRKLSTRALQFGFGRCICINVLLLRPEHNSDIDDSDEAIQDLVDNVANKLILDVNDPCVVDPLLKDTYNALPTVQYVIQLNMHIDLSLTAL